MQLFLGDIGQRLVFNAIRNNAAPTTPRTHAIELCAKIENMWLTRRMEVDARAFGDLHKALGNSPVPTLRQERLVRAHLLRGMLTAKPDQDREFNCGDGDLEWHMLQLDGPNPPIVLVNTVLEELAKREWPHFAYIAADPNAPTTKPGPMGSTVALPVDIPLDVAESKSAKLVQALDTGIRAIKSRPSFSLT